LGFIDDSTAANFISGRSAKRWGLSIIYGRQANVTDEAWLSPTLSGKRSVWRQVGEMGGPYKNFLEIKTSCKM
jgi:hypothetical protein